LAARTARAAVRIFADTYQLALPCLTLGQFNVEGYLPIDVPYRGDLQRGRSVRLSHVQLDIIRSASGPATAATNGVPISRRRDVAIAAGLDWRESRQ
jgi:hypothetical protein